jgi:hypothetical protein
LGACGRRVLEAKAMPGNILSDGFLVGGQEMGDDGQGALHGRPRPGRKRRQVNRGRIFVEPLPRGEDG